MFTVPNGQIVKSLNLSKDWARAVVDIPVPTAADLNRVNEVLRDVSKTAMQDDGLPDLLLDEPQLMGVESIEVDTVNLRMVARTLPGKQFEVGRELRALVVSALRRADIATSNAGCGVYGKTDELADRVPVGELIHAAVDLVEGDGRRDKLFDRQPARPPQPDEVRDVMRWHGRTEVAADQRSAFGDKTQRRHTDSRVRSTAGRR